MSTEEKKMKKNLLIALGIVVAVIVLFYFGLFLTA